MDSNFACVNKSFCRNANGAILVADITDQQSIEDCILWREKIEEIIAQNDTPIPMIFAANKVDLVNEHRPQPLQSDEELKQFGEDNGFISAIRVSAKNDINIASLFSQLTRQMLIKELT